VSNIHAFLSFAAIRCNRREMLNRGDGGELPIELQSSAGMNRKDAKSFVESTRLKLQPADGIAWLPDSSASLGVFAFFY